MFIARVLSVIQKMVTLGFTCEGEHMKKESGCKFNNSHSNDVCCDRTCRRNEYHVHDSLDTVDDKTSIYTYFDDFQLETFNTTNLATIGAVHGLGSVLDSGQERQAPKMVQ